MTRPWPADDGPEYDLREAIKVARQYTASELGTHRLTGGITADSIAEIIAYSIRYGDMEWTPDHPDATGTELDLLVFARLNEANGDAYAVITAWNDYTGWGCQDGADVRISVSREDAIKWAMGNEDRARLGYTLAGAQ